MKKLTLGLMTGLLLLVPASWVQAGPVVTYTVSGTPHNYVLTFSITNTLSVRNLNIYQFGIDVDAGDIEGSPMNWTPLGPINIGTNFPPSPDLTVNLWHNNSDGPLGAIESGVTISGFTVFSHADSLPASVRWYAIAYDFTTSGATAYPGLDSWFYPNNPLFTGTAAASTASPGPKGDTGPEGERGLKGDTGAKGDTGDTVPSGTVIFLVSGTPAPAGYTAIGTFSSELKTGGDRHDERDKDDHKGKITFVAYRKN